MVAGRRELAWAVGLVVGWLRERLRLNAGIGGVIAWVCRSFVKLRRYHVSGALGFVDLAPSVAPPDSVATGDPFGPFAAATLIPTSSQRPSSSHVPKPVDAVVSTESGCRFASQNRTSLREMAGFVMSMRRDSARCRGERPEVACTRRIRPPR